jgi:hypothetical protein
LPSGADRGVVTIRAAAVREGRLARPLRHDVTIAIMISVAIAPVPAALVSRGATAPFVTRGCRHNRDEVIA